MKQYYAYLMSNKSRTLYAGVTNDLHRRVQEHRAGLVPGFTAKYHTTMLVWYEVFSDVNQAIAAEKRIKGWTRAKKAALIEASNPGWTDLAAHCVAEHTVPPARGEEEARPAARSFGFSTRSC
jgi:putative endonuclease